MKLAPRILLLLLGVLTVAGQRRGGAPNNDSAAVNLVRTCESSVQDYYAMCAGWMTGMMLGIDASESRKDARSICFPVSQLSATPSVQQEELRKIFSKYVTAHPDKLNVHVGHVAYQALLEALPCKKPN